MPSGNSESAGNAARAAPAVERAAEAPTVCDGVTPIKPVDARKVVAVLRRGDFRKGQFETTEQFKERVSGMVDRARQLFVASSGIDEMVLTIPISEETIRYDADRGEMTGRIVHNDNLDLPGVQIINSSNELDTDLVNKAYGYGGTNYAAPDWKGGAATEWDLSLAADSIMHSYFTLTVAPSDARQVKDALAVLVVGKLTSPYFQHDHHVSSYGDVRVTELIFTKISCAALYDLSRGRILLKIDPPKL